jgi:hypothetical protein
MQPGVPASDLRANQPQLSSTDYKPTEQQTDSWSRLAGTILMNQALQRSVAALLAGTVIVWLAVNNNRDNRDV